MDKATGGIIKAGMVVMDVEVIDAVEVITGTEVIQDMDMDIIMGVATILEEEVITDMGMERDMESLVKFIFNFCYSLRTQ